MSIAALILTQPHETLVARLTLRHLRRGLGDDTAIITLVNGGGADDLRSAVAGDPRFFFVESRHNLGVAAGRARLLEHPVAVAAETIVILDNDILPTVGVCTLLHDALVARPDAGVIGAAIFDWGRIRARFPFGTDRPIENDVLKLCHRFGDARSYFHLGSHPDWRAAYLDEQMLVDEMSDLEPASRFMSLNQDRAAVIAPLADGDWSPVAASNIAGACQAFRRSLVDEIGSVDPIFSPYGYEDVDFCVRANEAGYRNEVLPEITIAHGTDQRHRDRKQWPARLAHHRNLLRCKTLLAARHGGEHAERIPEECLVRRYSVHIKNGMDEARAADLLEAGARGLGDARRQLHFEAHERERAGVGAGH